MAPAVQPPRPTTKHPSDPDFDSGPMTDSDLRGLVVDLVRAMNSQEGASAKALNELRGTTEALRESVDALHRTIDKRDKEVVEVIHGVKDVLNRVAAQEDRRLDMEQQRVLAEQEERKRQQDLEAQKLAMLGKERELEAAAQKDWREMVVGVLNSRISGGIASALSFLLVLWFSAWAGLSPLDVPRAQSGALPAFTGLADDADEGSLPTEPGPPTSPVPSSP